MESEIKKIEKIEKRIEKLKEGDERRKIDWVVESLSREGKKYLKERIKSCIDPDERRLGRWEILEELGITPFEWSDIKNGKLKVVLKKNKVN